ncbi:Signal transduction histidine kinase [Nocardiopsis flavescens]|uniref:histidine kinase n=1 Tax=Nocardiopsis flavescens TaxID=758803 RepID=A0A1M6QZL5_9ACTN|nr:histidine kinase [Nocardiopsis flavescens]SHK25576.1 Signal transduction histidine kinase [Nocardiopsis flavescens]
MSTSADRPATRRFGADLGLWAALGGLTVFELSGYRASLPWWEAGALLSVLALAAAVGLSRSRPDTAVAITLAVAVAETAAAGLFLTQTLLLTPFVSLAALALLAGRRSGRAGPIASMAVTAALVVLALYTGSTLMAWSGTRDLLSGLVDALGGALGPVAALVCPWLLGRHLMWRSRFNHGGWEVAEHMERTRAAEADRARLRERARIAARIHDSLGHDLALLAVRAAALEMSSQDSPERAASAAGVREAAHATTLRLREVIGVLRDGPGGEEAGTVPELVSEAVDAGMRVRLLREGPDPDPRTPGGRAVGRVVREALTNAARYAPGADVVVRVVRDGGPTRVEVADTGADTPAVPGRDDGTGLAALRAEVAALGGSLDAGPRPGPGFAVRARVPDGEAGDPDPAPSRTRLAREAARAGSRRSVLLAIAVPVAIALPAAAAGFALLWWTGSNSVLPPRDYGRMQVGDTRAQVEALLPRYAYPERSVDGAPPAPPGADCRYQLVRHENGLPPVYRLCFADGVLVSREMIDREAAADQ